MFTRRTLLSTPLALLLGLSCWDSCLGQVARYSPRTPTLSPYLNLTRFNGGGLPNYFALVRPQIQQRQFNLQAEAIARQQSNELTRIQNEVQQGLTPAGATGTGSWFMTPGSQTSYLDTSGYFPQPTIRPRR